MYNYNSRPRQLFSYLCLPTLVLLVLCPSTITQAQTDSPSLERAIQLYEAQNFVAALPLLEQASSERPNDPFVLSRLGFALYAVSATEKDADVRKKLRDRARDVLLKSRSAGDDSNLTQSVIEALSHDDTVVPFSNLSPAEAAMRQGEAAFVRGDLDAALGFYKKALELDPKLYSAALYAGDSEFKKAHVSKDQQFRKDHLEQAGIWFSKAISIDPNRETAYRYWGDALDLQGKTEEARDKFVEAIVAEPYNKRGYMGLMQWGERHGIPMSHPNVVVPTSVSSAPNGSVTITLDDKALAEGTKDGTAAWLLYGTTRASWTSKNGKSEKFTRAYPGETVYRHSLMEEVEALKVVAELAAAQFKEKRVTVLNPSLVNLIKLKDAGLLEAYVLFARANQNIANDYDAYRTANREKLRRYWLDMVISAN